MVEVVRCMIFVNISGLETDLRRMLSHEQLVKLSYQLAFQSQSLGDLIIRKIFAENPESG